MSRNDRPSRLRYKAMLEDVATRVQYAVSVNDRANPYAVDDKRHDRFTRELYRALAVARLFNDICETMGANRSAWKLHEHPHPGPVISVECLIQDVGPVVPGRNAG